MGNDKSNGKGFQGYHDTCGGSQSWYPHTSALHISSCGVNTSDPHPDIQRLGAAPTQLSSHRLLK